jgi:hypothetical protein
MSLRTWFAICTVSYAVFGIALLVATSAFLSIYDVELNPGGALIARILGAALIGYTLIYWNLRSADAAGLRAVFLGSLVYNVIGVAISTNAVLSGLANAMGWTVVLLHACLAAGFAYFLFGKPVVAPAHPG